MKFPKNVDILTLWNMEPSEKQINPHCFWLTELSLFYGLADPQAVTCLD